MPKRSAMVLAALCDDLADAEIVTATFRVPGTTTPFVVTGRFARIENAYGRSRSVLGGLTRIGIDSWHVVLTQLLEFKRGGGGAHKSWLPAEKGVGLYPANDAYIETCIKNRAERELWLPIHGWKFEVLTRTAEAEAAAAVAIAEAEEAEAAAAEV